MFWRLLVLGLAGCAATPATTSVSETTSAPGGESARVVSVTDGASIEVDLGGRVEPLRLIGIDSPEAGECYSDQSAAALETLVDGETVTLVRDVSERDRFDRLLRYVYLEDGAFVNEALVRDGNALAREYPPDVALAWVLEAAEETARAEGVGLWTACAATASEGLNIVDVEYDAPGNDNLALNGEWVEVSNFAIDVIDLTGWVLRDESAVHRYRFPDGFTLPPNAMVRVFTGCGVDTDSELYWCNDGAVWNNDGDTAMLLDSNGEEVARFEY